MIWPQSVRPPLEAAECFLCDGPGATEEGPLPHHLEQTITWVVACWLAWESAMI